MNGQKHTGVADATNNNEYASYGQLLANATPLQPATAVGGSADAITLTPTPAISAYARGQSFRFIAEADNTGAVTVAISGQTTKAIVRNDGANTALSAGDIQDGAVCSIVYDGTRFILHGAFYSTADFLSLSGGTMTGLLTLSGAPTSALHAATKGIYGQRHKHGHGGQ